MSKRTPRRAASSRRSTKTKGQARPSVPPSSPEPVSALGDTPALLPELTANLPVKPANLHYALPKNSVVRQKAMAIMAMRLAGYDDDAIGKEIGITGKTVKHYLYLAGRNGWLPRRTGLISPQDDIEYNLAHKVVRNLEEMLDDKHNVKRRDVAALEIAKGAIFKKFGQEDVAPIQQTLVAFKIEMPTGLTIAIREGTTGGTPNFVEADVIETSKSSDAA